MIMRNAIAAFCGAALMLATTGAASAESEGWVLSDLGTTPTREDCMRKSESAVASYTRDIGAGFTEADNWVFYVYDLEPGLNHGVIICPNVEGVHNGFLIIFGTTTEDERWEAHDTLRDYWEAAK